MAELKITSRVTVKDYPCSGCGEKNQERMTIYAVIDKDGVKGIAGFPTKPGETICYCDKCLNDKLQKGDYEFKDGKDFT